MRPRLTGDQKLAIINEFFESKLTINKFCELKGMPTSTLSTWVRLYNASCSSGPNAIIPANNFLNVTDIAKGQTKEVINSTSTNGIIKLELNGLKLEFDISNLKNVIEVLNG